MPSAVPQLGSGDPTPPPQVGDALMCSRCEQFPAVSAITARWVQSYGMWFSRRQSSAALCAICGHQVLDEANGRCLTQGLWGPAAAVTSFITVSHNNKQRQVLPPIPAVVDGQRLRNPAHRRPLVYVALAGWVAVIGVFIAVISGVNFHKTGPADFLGTCWTNAQQAQQVSCGNGAASDKIVGIVAKPADCQSRAKWDRYYLRISELSKYGCLEKITH
jgi:hypothetical protein